MNLQFFQSNVAGWVIRCFGWDIANDTVERNDRFIEESLELVQSLGYTADRAHALVDYVFNRPVGEPRQELGGVGVTLAALATTNVLNMEACFQAEMDRISTDEMVAKIRAKQAAKPTGSALPIAVKETGTIHDIVYHGADFGQPDGDQTIYTKATEGADGALILELISEDEFRRAANIQTFDRLTEQEMRDGYTQATELAPGVILHTRDGKRRTNAIVVKVTGKVTGGPLHESVEMAWLVHSDFGNAMKLTAEEIHQDYTLGMVTDYDRWFDDRLEAIRKNVP
jgi:hypothetical protein